MKRALVSAAAVVLLAGCAHAAQPKDPFVGTWIHSTAPQERLVIRKLGNDYVVVASQAGGWQLTVVMSRQPGDHLVAQKNVPGFRYKPNVDTYPALGQVSFSLFGLSDKLTKVSDSTAAPTPWPS